MLNYVKETARKPKFWANAAYIYPNEFEKFGIKACMPSFILKSDFSLKTVEL